LERERERSDEIAAAAFFGGDDGGATSACVAAEREHGHARVDARGDHPRVVSLELEFLCASVAPRGTGCAAAATLQRQHEVEHAASVEAGTDTSPSGHLSHTFRGFVCHNWPLGATSLSPAGPAPRPGSSTPAPGSSAARFRLRHWTIAAPRPGPPRTPSTGSPRRSTPATARFGSARRSSPRRG